MKTTARELAAITLACLGFALAFGNWKFFPFAFVAGIFGHELGKRL